MERATLKKLAKIPSTSFFEFEPAGAKGKWLFGADGSLHGEQAVPGIWDHPERFQRDRHCAHLEMTSAGRPYIALGGTHAAWDNTPGTRPLNAEVLSMRAVRFAQSPMHEQD